MKFASVKEIGNISRLALDKGLFDDEDTSVIFINLDIVDDRLALLKSAFPEETQHAIAVKSNPLQSILKHIVSRGFSLEAASMSELRFGVAAGIAIDKLVFDSPAKTQKEIDSLRQNFPGCRVNADSIEELSRYPSQSGLRLGLRINPLFSSNAQSSMNVGGAYSKFGEPISNEAQIIETCVQRAELDCLHLHIGSQASNYGPSIKAISKMVEIAEKINHIAGSKKIDTLDIGGGFPVNYKEGPAYDISDYAIDIKKTCPQLWNGEFKLITEFGRYIHANAAWCLSEIEYVKSNPQGKTITTQVGADMFLRECYNSNSWFHKMSVLDESLMLKEGPEFDTRIGGPLCFGGDYIGEPQKLVECVAGDKLVIRDVGANTFSLWSKHCSRPFPKVISYSIERDELLISKERESEASILKFWS